MSSSPPTSSEAPSQSPIVAVGEVISGKFKIERIIGEGAMGVVAAATHLQLGEHVALKFLRPQALKNPDAVARFAQEARAAARLKSEHVARVLDVGIRADGTPFIVMEHLEGLTLARLVRKGPLPISDAVEYAVQACEGLAEAHARGIIHRDIKPENLFIVERAEGWRILKILDFGISKATLVDATFDPESSNVTTGQAIMGSPCYMSPEQLRSTTGVDLRADIWSLGAVLYELVTGHSAFDPNRTLPELVAQIIQGEPPPMRALRPDLPSRLEQIILRCLEKDRDKRFANAAELAVALLPFAPKRSRAAVERATSVTRTRNASRAVLPPSTPPPPSEYAKTALSPGMSPRPTPAPPPISGTLSRQLTPTQAALPPPVMIDAIPLPPDVPDLHNAVIGGKYRVLRLIGSGGMGTVWEGVHESLDQKVAIKFIKPAYAEHPDARARFEIEARAAARLRTKHAVKVFDYGVTEEGIPYIVMEYLEGRSLSELLMDKGPLSGRECGIIFGQAARALTKAHASGIVHRDLKPDNIFLATNTEDASPELPYSVKLVDFGIAKMVEEPVGPTASQRFGGPTQEGAVVGTPNFMSPEQLTVGGAPGALTDIWSLGACAFTAMTARIPFEGEVLGDIVIKVCVDPLPVASKLNPQVPSGFDAWFAKACSRDPKKRYQTVAEMGQALELVCGTSDVHSSTSLDDEQVQYMLKPASPDAVPSEDIEVPSSMSPRTALLAGLVLGVTVMIGILGMLAWRQHVDETVEPPAPSATTSASLAPPAAPATSSAAMADAGASPSASAKPHAGHAPH